MIEVLLKAEDIDVNKANNDGWTPLYWAAMNGETEVVERYSGRGY